MTARLVTQRSAKPDPHPAGARWMKMKALVRAAWGDTCHLCGHGGATHTDHLVPVMERPDMAWHLANLRPAHGSGGRYPNPCPTCGLLCNQVRGTRSVEAAKAVIAQRQQQTLTLFPRRGQDRKPRHGRVWLREAARWRQAGRVRSRRPSAVKSVACQPTQQSAAKRSKAKRSPA
jgi:hypothetical protein